MGCCRSLWVHQRDVSFFCKYPAHNRVPVSVVPGVYCVYYNTFVEMTKYLLTQPGNERVSLLSERVSQDPLENYFGMQRARGRRCDNPTIKESLQNAVAIRVCSNRSAGERHQTSYRCKGCKAPLCPYPCMERYHTLKDYKTTKHITTCLTLMLSKALKCNHRRSI